jgi:hypothetical protein
MIAHAPLEGRPARASEPTPQWKQAVADVRSGATGFRTAMSAAMANEPTCGPACKTQSINETFAHDFSRVPVRTKATGSTSPETIGPQTPADPAANWHARSGPVEPAADSPAPLETSEPTTPAEGGRQAPRRQQPQRADDRCAIQSARFIRIPRWDLRALPIDGGIFAPFQMQAEFTAPPNCSCARGEYRQRVRGTQWMRSRNGIERAPNVHPRDFREDIDRTGRPYGHRDWPPLWNDQYLPNRQDGCRYEGSDAPGRERVPRGATVTQDLYFEGKLLDIVSRREFEVVHWRVNGSVTMP